MKLPTGAAAVAVVAARTAMTAERTIESFMAPILIRHGGRYRAPMPKQRIDSLLAERGLAGSRTSAAESVRAGRVRLGPDGPIALKPSQLVADDVELTMVAQPRFVSRGGIKLENALDTLAIDVAGLD